MVWCDLRIGSVCSGVGGLELGLEWAGVGTVAWQAEVDPHASQVLVERWGVPNHGDITTACWERVEPIDVLCGGIPCQPWSTAGRRLGAADPRHLWPAAFAAVRVLRPRLVVVEEVAGFVTGGGFDVLARDLAAVGYVGRWLRLRASDIGAPHRRERIFILAGDAECPRTDALTPSSRSRGAVGEPSGGAPPDTTDGLHGHERRGMAGQAASGQRAAEGGSGRLVAGREGAPANAANERYERDGRARDGRPGLADDSGPTSLDAQSQRRRSEGPQRGMGAEERGQDAPDTHQPGPQGPAWGGYEPAIRRWEGVLGRPAPDPVDERGRLSAVFTEWMMGMDEGWVTDLLPRSPALRALGNAVVPQAAEQVGRLLEGA